MSVEANELINEQRMTNLASIAADLESAPLATLREYEDQLCAALQSLSGAYNRWLMDHESNA